jgi:hypothetical protein
MIGQKVTRGATGTYVTALQQANLTLPLIVTDDQHSTLEPFSRWVFPAKEGYVVGAGKTCK